jgi:DNA (cytosine-5)-methyltransferase 1
VIVVRSPSSGRESSQTSTSGQIPFLDLFCGTGGFSHGFTNYNRSFTLACAVDILEIPALTCKANNPDALVICDDIRKIKPSAVHEHLKHKEIPLIVGGPPCQGFSSLRPFRSSEDEDPRNSLFENFAAFVRHFGPRVFVLENVVGLLTHKNGGTLNKIQECFAKMQYDTDWRVLNAANYGVPQKRERFILVGVQRGGRIEFPEPTHSFNGRSIGYKDKKRMITHAGILPNAISVMEAIGDLPSLLSGETATNYDRPPETEYQRRRRNGSSTLTMHKAARHSRKILDIIRHAGDSIECIPKHLITSGFSSCYSRLSPNEPATTLTVKFMSAASSKCIHPSQDRALTPREGARLQSYDDDFVFCGSITDVVTQIGNAVPPLLGEAIAASVHNILEGKHTNQLPRSGLVSERLQLPLFIDYE